MALCSTVQYSTVQYSTVQYNAVQYSTVQYSTVQYITVGAAGVSTQSVPGRTRLRPPCWGGQAGRPLPYFIVLYCTVLYCTVLYCKVLYCTVLYSTVLYCTVLYCTIFLLYCNIKAGLCCSTDLPLCLFSLSMLACSRQTTDGHVHYLLLHLCLLHTTN